MFFTPNGPISWLTVEGPPTLAHVDSLVGRGTTEGLLGTGQGLGFPEGSPGQPPACHHLPVGGSSVVATRGHTVLRIAPFTGHTTQPLNRTFGRRIPVNAFS